MLTNPLRLTVLAPFALGVLLSEAPSPSARALTQVPALAGPSIRHNVERAIYVSPKGKDSNPGTKERPIHSLPHARDVVRSLNTHMTGDIVVHLDRGTYRLTHALGLGPGDSGAGGHDVVWTGPDSGEAVVSGATRIYGWKLRNERLGIWAARVPKWLNTRQIYVNGMRATMASGLSPTPLYRGAGATYQATKPVMAHWRNPSQIDFVYRAQLGQMVEPICPVGGIKGSIITMAEPCWNNSTLREANYVGYGTLSAPTYIENAFELLDKPGEFYLDRIRHLLYYIPRKGENMHTADVEAPVLQTLVTGRGGPAARIHDITFANLQFSYATWLQPGSRQGFSEIQAGYTINGRRGYATQGLCRIVPHGTCPFGAWTKEPANVQFSYDRAVSFLNDRFVHLGAAGLNLDEGSQDATVEACVFTDISGNGLEIGNVDRPEAVGVHQTRNVRVLDNHLYGMPAEYHGGVAILAGYVADTVISHNQIDHIPYTGISMGWGGWPDKIRQPPVANYSHGNVVSDNRIYDFLQIMADGGAIYTQGITGTSMANGMHVTGNVIHGLLEWGEGLHSDNGATYVTYTHNVLYGNSYDWSGNHYDYRRHPGTYHPRWYDPQAIVDNYWQQGYPNQSSLHMKARLNKIITGPDQAPASIVASAGIEPEFRSVLLWRPDGYLLPNPPEHIAQLYAFEGKAYLTWHASYAEGRTPVTSYTIRACRATSAWHRDSCPKSGVRPVTVPASVLDRIGYAIVPGLSDGVGYRFSVIARNKKGASTPSISSPVITPTDETPGRPGKPAWGAVLPGRGAASIAWYPPKNAGEIGPLARSNAQRRSVPVLGYRVTVSDGPRYWIRGHRTILLTNTSGRVVTVLRGLSPGKTYSFSIAAISPAGMGPSVTSGPITPSS